MDRGSGGAVEHDDTLREQAAKDIDSFPGIGHQQLGLLQGDQVNYQNIRGARASQFIDRRRCSSLSGWTAGFLRIASECHAFAWASSAIVRKLAALGAS
jgi:hypothetical protein